MTTPATIIENIRYDYGFPSSLMLPLLFTLILCDRSHLCGEIALDLSLCDFDMFFGVSTSVTSFGPLSSHVIQTPANGHVTVKAIHPLFESRQTNVSACSSVALFSSAPARSGLECGRRARHTLLPLSTKAARAHLCYSDTC